MEVYKKVRAYIEGSGCGQFAVAYPKWTLMP